jgi:hypothetical protein
MGETGYSRRNLGLDSSAKNVISPVNLGVILRKPPRSPNRAHSRRIFLVHSKANKTDDYAARNGVVKLEPAPSSRAVRA